MKKILFLFAVVLNFVSCSEKPFTEEGARNNPGVFDPCANYEEKEKEQPEDGAHLTLPTIDICSDKA